MCAQLALPFSSESTSSAAGILVEESVPLERRLALLILRQVYGERCCASSANFSRGGSSSKTWLAELSGWMSSGGGSAVLDIRGFLSRCRRQMSALRTSAHGFSSLLATPTRQANQWYPSMRKWRSCRAMQDAFPDGPSVRVWEWMMGFPAHWLR